MTGHTIFTEKTYAIVSEAHGATLVNSIALLGELRGTEIVHFWYKIPKAS